MTPGGDLARPSQAQLVVSWSLEAASRVLVRPSRPERGPWKIDYRYDYAYATPEGLDDLPT